MTTWTLLPSLAFFGEPIIITSMKSCFGKDTRFLCRNMPIQVHWCLGIPKYHACKYVGVDPVTVCTRSNCLDYSCMKKREKESFSASPWFESPRWGTSEGQSLGEQVV